LQNVICKYLKFILLFLGFAIYSNFSISQQTIIKGKVTDATTLEPIAFANVFFKSSTIGTITDFDGFFELITDKNFDSLTVSFIGYKPFSKAIINGTEQNINFQLMPSMIQLSEVTIVPGENPAITLLKKIWQNKKQNNYDNFNSYEFDSYNKTQVYLRRFNNKEKPKDTTSKSVFYNYAIISDDCNKAALPVYMSETYSKVYYLNNPEREKVVINAVNSNSLADVETFMLTQLIQKNTKYNFYDNYVKIFDKNFISPISTLGRLYYKYYLVDSLFIDNNYCYEIQVKPRRKEDLTFTGTLWINDTSFAIKRISVEVDKQADINFIKRIKIQQDFNKTQAGVWFPSKTRILSDAVNIFINSYTVNNNFYTNNEYPLSFYNQELIVSDSANRTSENFWVNVRPVDFDAADKKTISNIDSLKNITYIKLLTKLVNMSIKGYFNLGKIELGPYLLLYKYNNVEGNRFRLGFQTNSTFSTKVLSKGYVAYGTKDKKLKYNAQLEYFLSRKKWSKIGMQYSQDVENLGAIDEFYSNSAFMSFASSFGGADKLNTIKVGRAWIETDLFRGFTQKIILKNKFYSPLSPDYHFAYYLGEQRLETKSDITVSEISFVSIYQPKALLIIDKNNRFPVSIKKYPTITANYTLGLKNVLNSDFSFHKASLNVKHNILLGGIGSFSYDLNLSKCFSSLPYPLLYILSANESFFRTEKTFNMMKIGEFIADQSLELFCTFRQDGFILDKIPLIKKLKLRTVATVNMAYGSFNNYDNGIYNADNNPNGILPAELLNGNKITTFKTLKINKPYIEVSYGIENIFKFFRIDAIHRLTYLSDINDSSKIRKYAIKFGAVFRF